MIVSFTKIKTYLDCEYAYYLRYVKKIATPKTGALAYGETIHSTVKTGYELSLDRDEWEKLFKREWTSLAWNNNIIFANEKEYYSKLNKGKADIVKYYDTFVKDNPAPRFLEYRFTKNTGVKLGNHIIIGAIDIIDAANNIIDIKTGIKPREPGLEFDLQLILYSYAFRQIFGEKFFQI